MAQCQRIIESNVGDRRCARDATRTAGDMLLCWQHYDALESALAMPLIVERADLLHEIEQLKACIPPDRIGIPFDTRPWTIYIARMPMIATDHPRYGMVKIGRTRNLAQRMDTLGLEVVLAFEDQPSVFEGELHRRFAHLRVDREWFRMGPEIAALFEAA